MKKKILFVDFDGVLRPFGYTEANEMLYNMHSFCKTRDIYGYHFAPYSLEALRMILMHTGAYMVISSDWRKNGLSEITEMWQQRGYPFIDRILGITPFSETQNRGHEISQWLSATHHRIQSYCILDDRQDMGSKHEGRHVLINKKYGLTSQYIEQTAMILNQTITKHPDE